MEYIADILVLFGQLQLRGGLVHKCLSTSSFCFALLCLSQAVAIHVQKGHFSCCLFAVLENNVDRGSQSFAKCLANHFCPFFLWVAAKSSPLRSLPSHHITLHHTMLCWGLCETMYAMHLAQGLAV